MTITTNGAVTGVIQADQAAWLASSVSGGFVSAGAAYWILGDSLVENNLTLTGTTPGWNDYGWITWGAAKAGGRGRLLLNLGLTGDTCQQIYNRLVTQLASTALTDLPAACFVLGGKNDATVSAATQYLALIYSLLRSYGIKVLACTVPPYQTGNGAATNSRAQVENGINDWIAQKCRNARGMYLVDIRKDVANPLVDPLVTKAGYMRADNMHFAAQGARAAGENSVYQAFIDTFPPNTRRVSSMSESININASSNQLLQNPLLTGSGGTAIQPTGTITGTIAQNWQVEISGGLATGVVASVPARSDGFGNDQQIVCTFAGASDSVRINSGTFTSSLTTGDTVQCQCELSMSGASNVSGIEVYLNMVIGGVTTFFKALARTSTPFSQTDFAGYVFESPEFLLTGAVTNAQFVVRTWSTAAGGVTLKMGRPSVRKVTPMANA